MEEVAVTMIQDIYPHKLYNQYRPDLKIEKTDVILNISDNYILVNQKDFAENVLTFPLACLFLNDNQEKHDNKNYEGENCESENYEGNANPKTGKMQYTYLFAIDDTKFFLCNTLLEENMIPAGYGYVEEKSLRKEEMAPPENIFAAITGKHLSDWYRDNCFCGRCGNQMVHSQTERAMTCEKCHYTSYPRIMPAVIVGVTNGDKLLITRYRTGFAHNALIAGFTEIGETVEETVAREVMEEAGIKVKNIRYYKSQPWGSANDILLGFYCDVDGDDTITMDCNELKYAQWVPRQDIRLQPGNFSLTNEMMKRFKTNDYI